MCDEIRFAIITNFSRTTSGSTGLQETLFSQPMLARLQETGISNLFPQGRSPACALVHAGPSWHGPTEEQTKSSFPQGASRKAQSYKSHFQKENVERNLRNTLKHFRTEHGRLAKLKGWRSALVKTNLKPNPGPSSVLSVRRNSTLAKSPPPTSGLEGTSADPSLTTVPTATGPAWLPRVGTWRIVHIFFLKRIPFLIIKKLKIHPFKMV